VSGVTSDMKVLLETRATSLTPPRRWSSSAVLRKHIGALVAVLGGIDTLVFTGGIGERAAPVREDTCRGLEHLGIQIDHMRNARHDPVISAPGSVCTVRIVPTDEDLMVARHTRALLARSAT